MGKMEGTSVRNTEPSLGLAAWEGLQGAALGEVREPHCPVLEGRKPHCPVLGVRKPHCPVLGEVRSPHCPVLLCCLVISQQHCLLAGVCPAVSKQSRKLLLPSRWHTGCLAGSLP